MAACVHKPVNMPEYECMFKHVFHTCVSVCVQDSFQCLMADFVVVVVVVI